MRRHNDTSLRRHINSIGSPDKSNRTEDSWQVNPSPDSLPQLQNHEISQIISDVIDNLPPGSLLPLEESIFARGSKRNIKYQTEQKTKMASSINRRANFSASHIPQHLTDVSKSDQNGLALANRFSSLADQHQRPEKDSQITSKSLIGPGLYAKSGRRDIPKDVGSEDGKGRIHTYSPTPGVVLKFESVDKSLLSTDSSKDDEKSKASSLNHPSTLIDVAETTSFLQETRVPPHLRPGQSSDPVKSETSSISDLLELTQVGSPKALHTDDPVVREVMSHGTPAVNPFKVEEEVFSPFESSIAPAVRSVASEGKASSTINLIKEKHSNESSLAIKNPPPHLRNAQRQIPEKSNAKSQGSTPSVFFSSDKRAPHEKRESPVIQPLLPVSATGAKHNGSTISAFSVADEFTNHENGKTAATQQVLPISATGAKYNGSTTSAFSIADEFTNHENGKTAVIQQVLIVNDTETKSNVATISKISNPRNLIPHEESKGPVPWQILPKTSLVPRASSSEEVGSDLNDALYFKAWPESEQRDTSPAEIRTVIIRNLPYNATPSLVASIVSGGPLERVDVKGSMEKASTARVLFLHAKDCQKFYDVTANGLDYIFEDRRGVADVDKGTDVDVVSGQARTYIQLGTTRCVRVMDIRSGLKDEELKKKFREKAASHNRMVEDVIIGTTEKDLRFIIVRFCDIRHAVHFKTEIVREEEWEQCNIHFSPDPCAR